MTYNTSDLNHLPLPGFKHAGNEVRTEAGELLCVCPGENGLLHARAIAAALSFSEGRRQIAVPDSGAWLRRPSE